MLHSYAAMPTRVHVRVLRRPLPAAPRWVGRARRRRCSSWRTTQTASGGGRGSVVACCTILQVVP